MQDSFLPCFISGEQYFGPNGGSKAVSSCADWWSYLHSVSWNHFVRPGVCLHEMP